MNMTVAIIDPHSATARALTMVLQDRGCIVHDLTDSPADTVLPEALQLIIADWSHGPGLEQALKVRHASGRILPIVLLMSKFDTHRLLVRPDRLTICPIPASEDTLWTTFSTAIES